MVEIESLTAALLRIKPWLSLSPSLDGTISGYGWIQIDTGEILQGY